MAKQNRGPELLGVNIAFITLAVSACALRCFVRARMVRAFGLDDWLMVGATLFFMMYTTSSNVGVHYGTGRHYSDLTTENIAHARHCWYLCYLFYSVSMMAAKMSIGVLLLRVSVKKLHTWILYCAMFVSVVAGSTFFFVCLFQCYPVQFMWDKTIDNGKCVNTTVITALAYVYSVFSILSDLTFAIIPGFLVWDLQMKRKAKVALIPLITMGCIASAAVIARLPFIRFFDSPDFLWATTDIAIWSSVEQGLAITAGSLATIRPLFFKIGILTRPTGHRPSNYGNSAQAKASALSERQQSRLEKSRDMYDLSVMNQTRRSDDEPKPYTGEFPKTQTWLSGGFSQPASKGSKKTERDNESEKSLHMKSARSSEDDNMGIMVSKSFYITDEERGSMSSSGDLHK